MAELEQETGQNDQVVDETTDTPAEAENTDSQGLVIPKERFDAVNKRMKDAETRLQKFERDQEEAERKRREEEGQYKELYGELQVEREKLQAQIKQSEVDSLRMRVANQKGYPMLWGRLSGETEEEIESDLESLLGSMPRPQAPSLDGGAGGGDRGRDQVKPITEDQKNRLSGRFGINPKYIPTHKT
jgi:hypothetical protein